MKKYASILAALVLLLGLAALSYAAPAEIPSDTTAVIAKGKTQITLGGELRFRGLYGKNLDVEEKDTYPDSQSYYDYRVRLNLEAKVSPNTTGYVEVESNRTATNNSSENVYWGSGTRGPRGTYPVGNWHNESNLYIRQAWIQYQGTGLLGVPAGFKVGKQLIKLGYGLFFDHTYYGDDAILVFVQPLKELTIAAHTIKFSEGNIALNDDATAYGILAAYAGKGFGLSADVTYVDHQNFGTIGGPGPFLDIHLWNFGLRGNADDIAGTGLNFRADVEFQTGKIRDTNPDIKLRGWAALAGLDYKFKPIPLTLTLEYAIGSGNKQNTLNKDESFITALGPEQHYTFIYEYLAPTACFGTTGTGLCNTQYLKFGGSFDITKDINAKLYGYWLRAHRAVAINGSLQPDKDIGWEVDGVVTYQIDKGLKYWVEAGYFWPGDAYKLPNGKDADDAWAVRHGIQLNF
ncbi:alginate export family protein [Thermodesulfovibrio sp. 3462-1]|uniref:Alginate export family protein n=1 Tax=Thermodesulfovibrio obliviosus TaxID=3118332 RepID=A0AAU8GZK3_9BACT